jgi:hypothetical protein
MIDLFDELTYTDIHMNLEELKVEVATLDDDSLIEEVNEIQHRIIGKESDRIEHLVYKNYNGSDFNDDDLEFLRGIYLTYFAQYAVMLDSEEDDLLDED